MGKRCRVYDKGSLTREIRACLESLNDGVLAELGAVSIAEGLDSPSIRRKLSSKYSTDIIA
jgi:hypothetical protein